MTPKGKLQRGDRIRNTKTKAVYKVAKRFGSRAGYAVEVVDEKGNELTIPEIDFYLERGLFEYLGKGKNLSKSKK